MNVRNLMFWSLKLSTMFEAIIIPENCISHSHGMSACSPIFSEVNKLGYFIFSEFLIDSQKEVGQSFSSISNTGILFSMACTLFGKIRLLIFVKSACTPHILCKSSINCTMRLFKIFLL